jgi:hypothetical protein
MIYSETGYTTNNIGHEVDVVNRLLNGEPCDWLIWMMSTFEQDDHGQEIYQSDIVTALTDASPERRVRGEVIRQHDGWVVEEPNGSTWYIDGDRCALRQIRVVTNVFQAELERIGHMKAARMKPADWKNAR